MFKYLVCSDSDFVTGTQTVKLYKMENYRNRAVLIASGKLEEIQMIADELNGE